MILAESIASNINWTLIATIIMALATAGMWYDAKKSRVTQIEQPLNVTGTPLGNAEIQRDLKAMNHRLVALEQWRGQLIAKLDQDKMQVIDAGEDRARRIYEHVDFVRRELAEKIDDMPSKIIADLRNAKGLLE